MYLYVEFAQQGNIVDRDSCESFLFAEKVRLHPNLKTGNLIVPPTRSYAGHSELHSKTLSCDLNRPPPSLQSGTHAHSLIPKWRKLALLVQYAGKLRLN